MELQQKPFDDGDKEQPEIPGAYDREEGEDPDLEK